MSCIDPDAIDDLRSAVRHLHGLGFVHNNIHPGTVRLADNLQGLGKGTKATMTLIIGYFGSCRRMGESLNVTKARRTHGWHNPSVEEARVENDLEALDELQTWLYGEETALLFPDITGNWVDSRCRE